ncbi:hypothetical protein PQR33_28140 [Paraburkholderia sediminicola]|uniref:hypothetical protein n=1 Tax=Paraburkholderia sediminicola TaxID=458836 RepID=UPI0038B9D410
MTIFHLPSLPMCSAKFRPMLIESVFVSMLSRPPRNINMANNPPEKKDSQSARQRTFDMMRARREDALERAHLRFERTQAKRQNTLEHERILLEMEKLKSEHRAKYRELALRKLELRRAVWMSPMFLALIGAIVALIGNMIVGLLNLEVAREKNSSDFNIELSKASNQRRNDLLKNSQTLAFDLFKSNEAGAAVQKLTLLASLGVFSTEGTVTDAQTVLAAQKHIPSPPAASGATPAAAASAATGATAAANPASGLLLPGKQGGSLSPLSIVIGAQSAGPSSTTDLCQEPPVGYHFQDWALNNLHRNGDGAVWFVSQSKDRLCVRADASRTALGYPSSVSATLFANRVKDAQ